MIARKPSSVLYGADYHPDQWPEPVWQEDVQLMRKAGVNLVTLGLFSWARLQSGPGTYTFAWMDRALDLLHQHGIAVNLATATAIPPPWMSRLHPEILATGSVGEASSHGSLQVFCPNSAAYRQYSASLARQLATRYGPHPALAMWHVNHEYGSRAGACACEACAAGFRDWLRAKYATIEALNEQWGAASGGQWHHAWEEIRPPSPTPGAANPGQQLDYHRFMNESLLACFLGEKKILKEITPAVPVTTSFAGPYGLARSTNYFEWARHVDCLCFSSYPDPLHADPADVAFSLDLQRGLGGGHPWALLRQSSSQVNWRPQNAVKRPGQMRLWSYQALARGADGILFSHWRAPLAGSEKFHSAMLPHGGADTRVHGEIVQLGGELPRLNLACGGRTHAEIGFIVDWESYWALEASAPGGPADYPALLRSYYRALFEPDVPIDIVPPEADFSKYKIVVAPALYLVRSGVEISLANFVASGGSLVLSSPAGTVDANDRVHPGGCPGPFRRILGIHVEETEPLEPAQVRHLRTPERAAKCGQWIDLIKLEGAEAVATFTDDFYASRPAITRHAFGRGLAYYVGTQVELDFLRRLLIGICEETGARPPLKVPAGVEAVSRENDNGRFLFLLNHAAMPQFVELAGLEGLDLLRDEMVSGQIQLAPRDARVIHLSS